MRGLRRIGGARAGAGWFGGARFLRPAGGLEAPATDEGGQTYGQSVTGRHGGGHGVALWRE